MAIVQHLNDQSITSITESRAKGILSGVGGSTVKDNRLRDSSCFISKKISKVGELKREMVS